MKQSQSLNETDKVLYSTFRNEWFAICISQPQILKAVRVYEVERTLTSEGDSKNHFKAMCIESEGKVVRKGTKTMGSQVTSCTRVSFRILPQTYERVGPSEIPPGEVDECLDCTKLYSREYGVYNCVCGQNGRYELVSGRVFWLIRQTVVREMWLRS